MNCLWRFTRILLQHVLFSKDLLDTKKLGNVISYFIIKVYYNIFKILIKFIFLGNKDGPVEKWLSRWAHNPKIVGSIPTGATIFLAQ